MPYLRNPVQDWRIDKAYLGKAWESALPREELKAKYRDLPGYLIMQILDCELELGNLDVKDPGRVGPAELSLMESTSNSNPPTGLKWKSVEDILQWRTNSWAQLIVSTIPLAPQVQGRGCL